MQFSYDAQHLFWVKIKALLNELDMAERPLSPAPHLTKETDCERAVKGKERDNDTCPHHLTALSSTEHSFDSISHTKMNQDDLSQLPPQQHLDYPYQDYIPGAITPCATHVDVAGKVVTSLFHLLSCGHIVAVDDRDQRCGRNCQHAVTLAASQSLPGPDGSTAYVNHNLAIHV
jgi:hypothetical protein